MSTTPTDGDLIIVVRSDRVAAHAIRRVIFDLWPQTQTLVCSTVLEAKIVLATGLVWLAVFGLALPDGDALDLLGETVDDDGAKHTLVASELPDENAAEVLNHLPVGGYFDIGHERPEDIRVALQDVTQGRRYFSPTFRPKSLLIAGAEPLRVLLTPKEMIVFPVIADGCSDDDAAEQLAMKPRHRPRAPAAHHAKTPGADPLRADDRGAPPRSASRDATWCFKTGFQSSHGQPKGSASNWRSIVTTQQLAGDSSGALTSAGPPGDRIFISS